MLKENLHNKLFRALADETRLRVLNLLALGELCVCDIMATLGEHQAKVSRHLAYLRKAGLVKSRRQGLWVYYSLSEPKNALHKNLLGCVKSCFNEVPGLKLDSKKMRAGKSPAVCC